MFLDTVRDRYFCLSASSERAFLALIDPKRTEVNDDEIAQLVRHHVVEPLSGDARPRPCPPAPIAETSLLDAPPSPLDLLALVLAGVELARVSLTLRRRGFDALLAGVRRAKQGMMEDAPQARTAARVATAFARTSYFSSAQDRCLVRSIAVARRLLALDCRPDLILGVKLQPFRAHCWVQHQGRLVNDRIDVVRAFTPILLI